MAFRSLQGSSVQPQRAEWEPGWGSYKRAKLRTMGKIPFSCLSCPKEDWVILGGDKLFALGKKTWRTFLEGQAKV